MVMTALALLAAAVAIGREPGDYRQWAWLVMIFQVVGGGLVLAVILAWGNHPLGRRRLTAVIVVGVAMRLLVLPAERELSDDAARYHWDGKAIAHGVNPYMFSPDEPAVAWLWIDSLDDNINHPWNRTCYPPLAEGSFTLGYALTPGSLRGLQLLFLLAEIVTWILLAWELSRRERPPAWLLFLVWSPLVTSQGYLPGHVDMLILPWVMLLIMAVGSGQGARSGLWLALACLVKPLPLLILPAIVREMGPRPSLRLLATFAAVLVAAYLPFLEAGPRLFSSTWLMATDWSFNGSVAAGLGAVLPATSARLLAGLLTLVGMGLSTWLGRDFLSRAIGAFLSFVVFTTTLFPWYVISALPLAVLRPRPAILGLTILLPLADQVVIGYQTLGIWQEAAWVRWVQYLPFYALLGWELLISSRNRPSGGPSRKRVDDPAQNGGGPGGGRRVPFSTSSALSPGTMFI